MERKRGLRPEKRAAILTAARAVFADQGYERASTEAIAAAAGVSTRTLYNHFASKDQLFSTVLVEGARQVADAFLAAVAAIDPGADTETVLRALGRALVAHRLEFPEHFAMAQRVGAETSAFPDGLVAEWRNAGPLVVWAELERILAGLRDLELDDPREAGLQLNLLTAGAIALDIPKRRANPEAVVDSAVRLFLHGYAR